MTWRMLLSVLALAMNIVFIVYAANLCRHMFDLLK
jgi:hypothetical protein